MFSVVLDTNVIFSALYSQHNTPPVKILDMVFSKMLIAYISKPVFDEYADVLNRKKFEKRIPKEKAAAALSYILSTAKYAIPPTSFFPHFPDETDRKFYDLAKAADAYLITGNIKHFPQDDKIITPADFLRMV